MRILKNLLSIKSAIILMLIMAASIGVATFIENDYGTQTARALIYNARWFELLQLILAINLAYNIIRFRLFRKEKFFTGLFHAAFLIILVGAAVTRYFGYEGMMHIREGFQSSSIISDRAYLQIDAIKDKKIYHYEEPLYLSALGDNHFKRSIDIGGQKITIELKKYYPHAKEVLKPDSNGKPCAKIVVSAGSGRVDKILCQGESFDLGDAVIDFESGKNFKKPTINISYKNDKLFLKAPYKIESMTMGSFEKKVFDNLFSNEILQFDKSSKRFVIK